MQMTANLEGVDRMNAILRQTNPFPLQLSRALLTQVLDIFRRNTKLRALPLTSLGTSRNHRKREA